MAELSTYAVANPFPLTAEEIVKRQMHKVYDVDPNNVVLDVLAATWEVAELCKWILAHVSTEEAGLKLPRAKLCITMSNPHGLPVEQLFLQAYRANKL